LILKVAYDVIFRTSAINPLTFSKEEFYDILKSIQDINPSPTAASFQQSTGANSMSEYCFNKINVPLNVSFDKLTLSLKNGSSILSSVSGAIEAFQCSALMGPSGSGTYIHYLFSSLNTLICIHASFIVCER
jgi:ABC-type multidrug transport system fused ATPase/permease subunit